MSVNLRFFLDPALKAEGIEFTPPRQGDAGFDLRAAETVTIPAGEQVLIPTGLRVAIPLGFVGLLRDRSSTALKRLYTHAGVIDAAYRGEIKVVVSNGGREQLLIEKGQRIAQMVVVPCLTQSSEAASLEELGLTDRGGGGFGSTGS